jgi:hypothetical protein
MTVISGLAADPGEQARRTETLIYMADILAELETMAARETCATLAGLLALARREAELQARQGR